MDAVKQFENEVTGATVRARKLHLSPFEIPFLLLIAQQYLGRQAARLQRQDGVHHQTGHEVSQGRGTDPPHHYLNSSFNSIIPFSLSLSSIL